MKSGGPIGGLRQNMGTVAMQNQFLGKFAAIMGKADRWQMENFSAQSIIGGMAHLPQDRAP